jgi:hypothetical protein
MSERFKVTKFEEPAGKTYKNYGATSAESDVELKGKLLPDSGESFYISNKCYKQHRKSLKLLSEKIVKMHVS